MNKSDSHRAGMIALAGRPNVGKSTLLNCLLKQKLSITSKRANTTRYRILGVLNENNCQYVFVDTPGFDGRGKRLLDKVIHKTAMSSIYGVDVVLFIVDARGWHEDDQSIFKFIDSTKIPAILIINKIDRVKNREQLLPVMADLAQRTEITEIVPISALKRENIDLLKKVLKGYLSESQQLYPEDFVTDRSDRFQVGELVREQVFRNYGMELPYICAVELEKYELGDELFELNICLWVETDSQKKILIGAKGEKLKIVGTKIRMLLEKRFERKVVVKLWVKKRTKWTQNMSLMNQLGYLEFD